MATFRAFQPTAFQANAFQVGDVAPPVVSTFGGGDISSAFVVDSSGTKPLRRRMPIEVRRILLKELRRQKQERADQRQMTRDANRMILGTARAAGKGKP
jgi:hypothetical protein